MKNIINQIINLKASLGIKTDNIKEAFKDVREQKTPIVKIVNNVIEDNEYILEVLSKIQKDLKLYQYDQN